ncbi:Pentatricopeptide repeat-containing protein At2g33760 [Linum perenne]
MLLCNIPPSNYTFTSVIKSCTSLSSSNNGRIVHGHVLVHGYGIDVYVQSALVAFYCKVGKMSDAAKVFEKMPERGVVAWNSLISGYEQLGLAKEAIELFGKMRNAGIAPDTTTCVVVLAACAQAGELGLGRWVHDYVCTNGLAMTVVLGTSLVNMYIRCGDVKKAREVFDSMSERNVFSWTAMISGYGVNGYGREALELFRLMKMSGVSPNSVTFVAVLSGCAHAGLVDEGRRLFASMKEEYSLIPGVEHHVSMVDLLGRAGLVREAYKFIQESVPPNPAPAIWTAMLGACKMHKNFDLGAEVAEHLLAVEPENPGHYVMLSNIYASAGRMDRVEAIRDKMIQKSLSKQVGYSVIEIDGKSYLFSMGDKSHPEANNIFQYLDELMWRCAEAGYVPAPESVMHQLEEEEREYALRYHSEKLAIAFGLLKTSPGSVIRIVKNIRMCEDCHLAIKYISIVTKREIVVRDKLRFHHFKDGSCSCMDYW